MDKLTCPACGALFSLDAAANDAAARQFATLMASLDAQVGAALIPYLALFRPEKTSLRWSRALALAEELVPMIKSGRVTRNGIVRAAPREAWVAAMQHLAARPQGLRLPMKSHGYLLEVVAGSAEKAAAAAERATEATRQRGRDGVRESAPVPLADHLEHARAESRKRGAKLLGITDAE